MSSPQPSGKVTGFGGGRVVTTAENINGKLVSCESGQKIRSDIAFVSC